MTYAEFVVQFPEFRQTDASLVTSMLAAANLEIDRAMWRAKADQGQAFLAAHKLALSPFGMNTRLDAKDSDTTYWAMFKELRGQVTSGFRVC